MYASLTHPCYKRCGPSLCTMKCWPFTIQACRYGPEKIPFWNSWVQGIWLDGKFIGGKVISSTKFNLVHRTVRHGLCGLTCAIYMPFEGFVFIDRGKTISKCCLSQHSGHFYIGTEGGNLFTLDVKHFKLDSEIVYWNNATTLWVSLLGNCRLCLLGDSMIEGMCIY